MKIKVGKRDVIDSARFIRLGDEDVFLSFDVRGQEAKFRIQFVIDDSSEIKDQFGMKSDVDPKFPDTGLVTLVNWNGRRLIGGGLHVLSRKKEKYFLSISTCHYNGAYDVFVELTGESSDE